MVHHLFHASGPDSATTNETNNTGYQISDYSTFVDRIRPDDFQEDSYTPVLLGLMHHTLEGEAPISDDLLVQRVARAHGFKRSGRLIRNRVLDLVDDHFHLREDPVGGAFVWLREEQAEAPVAARLPSDEESIRTFDALPAEEIRAGAAFVTAEDPAIELARLFGIRRLSSSGRERIETALGMTPTQSSDRSESDLFS